VQEGLCHWLDRKCKRPLKRQPSRKKMKTRSEDIEKCWKVKIVLFALRKCAKQRRQQAS